MANPLPDRLLVTRPRGHRALQCVRGLLIAMGLALGLATPASALSQPNLHVYASGLVHNYPQWPASSSFQVDDAATGPITANAAAGNVFSAYHPDLGFFVDGTLFADSSARASYGTNGAAVESNLRPVLGDDGSKFPEIEFGGGTLRVEMSTESVWTDTFVITGGVGVGTANVDVTLGGFVETRYGANGDLWYPAGFEAYGTGGYGFAQYGLDIDYDVLPPGLDEEYNQPIRWSQDFLPPVPAYVTIQGPLPPGELTGSFVFEYGVPFSLSSSLSVSGYNQIFMDYDHTATLSQFVLPEGASLTSGSGHLYPVPEPGTLCLFGSGLLGSLGVARRRT